MLRIAIFGGDDWTAGAGIYFAFALMLGRGPLPRDGIRRILRRSRRLMCPGLAIGLTG